ncbi:beta strand repeat-containing protein [Microbacterium sp. CR_7]|uniref:beta strand repeat-containing protein n=1 Tax=Microbacterium sp. CR_7 TaxID=3055792 RepID=UPI0035C0AA50
MSNRGALTRPKYGARRRQMAAVLATILAIIASLFVATPAMAAPVYQIEGQWVDAPTSVAAGDTVVSEWRVNVNDDAAAPSNAPVDNVTATLIATAGIFVDIPALCLTDGVTPASSISADGTVLTCNLGTRNQGTSAVFLATVEANGQTGDALSISGSVPGDTAAVPPIPTQNPFSLDFTFGTPTNDYDRNNAANTTDYRFQWSLQLGANSEAGPNSITYTITTNNNVGATMAVGPGACRPFTAGVAGGHPWTSGNHPADQLSRFVSSCNITQTGANTFNLTLTGIDYSAVTAAQKDSTGAGISPSVDVIATGEIVLRVNSAAAQTINIQANTPTYTSVSGATYTDNAANNQAQKVIVDFGAFATVWDRIYTNSGGTNWDDTYRVPTGERVQASAITGMGPIFAGLVPADAQFGLCMPLDSRYVTYDSVVTTGMDTTNIVYEYYVGTAASVDPNSAGYDPNAFTCNEGGADIGATGWTTVEPADKSLVKAVRAQFPYSALNPSNNSGMHVRQIIKDGVAPGQDIWEFGGWRQNGGQWIAQTAPANGITNTPDARYPFTTGVRRDILRVAALQPFIEKSSDRVVAQPGETVVYTLDYQLSGADADGVADGVTLTDQLPVGLTYIPGSATPAPVITTRADGGQTLTWNLNGVPVETQQALTYQARVGADVEPGSALRNIAQAAIAGVLSDRSFVDVQVPNDGFTTIAKTADEAYIPNLAGDGVGTGSWTVTLGSQDPVTQAFTDTIDILPYNGDGRGTSFSGSYALTDVTTVAGSTVYYTDVDPTTLSDDPSDASNGSAGDPTGNTVGWTTTRPANVTAIRVLGPELLPGATQSFVVGIETDGVEGGDILVNRAQAIAEHTGLVMRTSAPITVANFYSASLKKYVQNAAGEWVDANTAAEYPTYQVGDTVPYRIVITNTGQGTLTDLVITDDLFPEGSFTVDELAPGAEEAHEFSIVLEAGGLDTVVNTACATAAIPGDSEVPPTINCDPAGIEVEGSPTHTKEIVSATPIGGGQWEIVYALTVTNTSTASTSYSLADELHFADEVTIASAAVTSSPAGVTLATPAWDGQGNVAVSADVPLLGSDDAGYAAHVYELTVVADVPLQLTPGGAPPAAQCDAEGADTDTAFNNTSALTLPSGEIEPDQACAPVPSIDITKSVSAGPTANGDGTWTVTYDVVATNDGGAAGVYDVTDRMTADGDLSVISGEVVEAPVATSPTWTGLGAEGAAENVIATDVTLPAGGTHTYRIEVIIGLAEGTEGSPVITPCSAEPGAGGSGLSNTAEIEHNDLTDDASACITVGVVTVDKSVSAGPTPNGDGTWTVVYDIVATNVGAADADYDVTDRLHFGEDIEIVEKEVRSLDGITVNAGWTGLGAAADAAENVIAEGITLAAGASHTYQVEVTVQMDQATIDPGSLECPAPGTGDAGGLANSTTLTSNGIVTEDEVCPTLPLIELDKELVAGSPTENGDGTWTIAYDVTATNTGQAAGDYTVTDQLQYGEGIEVQSANINASPAGVTVNAGWTGQGAAADAAENVIASDVTLDAGATHTYRVVVIASMDTAAVTPGSLECPAPGSGEAGGFANTAGLTHNGEDQADDACATPPLIEITKSLSGAVTPVDGQPGQYDATYEITVTNSGPGVGLYDLDDELNPGAGVEIVGVQSVTSDVAESVAINAGFNGLTDTRIVTDQPIAGAAGAPVVHTYTVVVRYSADLAGIDLPDGDVCTAPGGEALPGTLNNTATVDWNGIEDTDNACVIPGQPTLDKALVSANPVGDGQWEVVYDLTVGNTGTEATTYDLDDEFLFAPQVTVDTVTVTGPAGVDINDGFDGDADQRIATDVPIIGLDDDGYAPHVYRVTVTVNVPLAFDPTAVGSDGTASPACTAPAGDNFVEQGLNNAATLTDENDNTVSDTDCAALPSVSITKAMAGAPIQGADGLWTVNYTITVVNDGAAAGDYTATDRLRYGTGIEVRSAAVTAAPEGVTPAASWTGRGAEGEAANVVAANVSLAAGMQHVYRVTVVAFLNTATADSTAIVCPAPGSDGNGGFANTAGLSHNDLTADAEACAVPEWPEDVPPPLAITGGTIAIGVVTTGLLLLLAGAVLLYVRRRRVELATDAAE